MNKSKKIAIGLLSAFGTSILVSTPLIILSSTKKDYEVTDTKTSSQRYKLSSWIIENKKNTELLSYFYNVNNLVSENVKFYEKNINKVKVNNFFRNILFEIFKYSKDDYELNLKINYEINQSQNECKLNLNWHFVNKKQNIIFKNTKYYDILMLYF